MLIYPLKGRVLVGTTDIDADPREVPVCTEEEIDYFFDLIHHVFPSISVTREQIVYNFSGIRPLPATRTPLPDSSHATTASRSTARAPSRW